MRIGVVALAAAAVWFRLRGPLSGLSIIGILGLVIGGWPIFKEAAENVMARRMTMELSMTIAILAAAAISQFFTALVITLFVLVAEVLEGMTVSRGRRAIHDLLDLLPRSVAVRRAGAVRNIAAEKLRVGGAVPVNPGGRIPVDGIVLSGHSFVDQARITGEPMPVEKGAGATVYAGTINQSGVLEIRAERLGRDTSYARLSRRSNAPGARARRYSTARAGKGHVRMRDATGARVEAMDRGVDAETRALGPAAAAQHAPVIADFEKEPAVTSEQCRP